MCGVYGLSHLSEEAYLKMRLLEAGVTHDVIKELMENLFIEDALFAPN